MHRKLHTEKTTTLKAMLDDGLPVEWADLATLSPYITWHIQRFGAYQLSPEPPSPACEDTGGAASQGVTFSRLSNAFLAKMPVRLYGYRIPMRSMFAKIVQDPARDCAPYNASRSPAHESDTL